MMMHNGMDGKVERSNPLMAIKLKIKELTAPFA